MKTARLVRSPVLSMVILAAGQAFAETTVVVNSGPHASAQAAGHSEAKVDWLDADDTVCTECFAALELQSYLRKMTARANDFVIVGPVGVEPIDLGLAVAGGLGRGVRAEVNHNSRFRKSLPGSQNDHRQNRR